MTQEAVNDIRDALLPVFERHAGKVVFAYLFGSAAHETGYPPGDVDIAVLPLAGRAAVLVRRKALSLCRFLQGVEEKRRGRRRAQHGGKPHAP